MALTKKIAFIIGLETAFGDGATPATYLPLFIDGKPKLVKDIHEQDIYKGSLAKSAFIVGKKWYELNGKFYLKGSGTAGTAPELSALLQIAGLVETVNSGTSVVYAPSDSTADKSAGLKVNIDGVQHYLKGVRAKSLKLNLEAGKPCLCEVNLMGLYNEPTVVSFPTVTFTNTAIMPPICETMALTIGGTTHVIKTFNINLDNELNAEDSINAASGQNGINEFVITSRSFTFETLVKRDTSNDTEYFNKLTASTEVALASTGFGSAGNKIAVAAGALQIEDVEIVDEAGEVYYNVKGRINYNASEFSLTLT